jgi:ubiquinone/menaquinone biosynthesis C-methylase UbiE
LYPAMPSPIDKILGKLGQVSGKHICEIGCGRGRLTRELAARGAYVSASDISAEAVALTRKTTEDFIPKLVDVKEMDASNLLYDDNSFDLVVGLAILHHVDIDKASKDINRVLKRGGKAVFIEPLVHNPISNIWRMLTPGARTPHERPLAYSEIRKMGKQFSSVEYQEYALLTLLSSFVYLISHSHKAKRKSAELLARLEPAFLKIFKPLRRYCGAILIEFTK